MSRSGEGWSLLPFISVAVKEQSFSELTIYPNPTDSLLTIETEYADHYSIEFTTLNGQELFSTEMEGTTHQIDLASFQKGVYLITIRSEFCWSKPPY